MFATDRNRGQSTFGFPPPDPAQIQLLSDQETCAKANVAFESLMTKWGAPKTVKSGPTATLYVYRAGNLYAVVLPVDARNQADISSQFMFFDSRWNYLGDRSQ
jgi:hypothetical protein